MDARQEQRERANNAYEAATQLAKKEYEYSEDLNHTNGIKLAQQAIIELACIPDSSHTENDTILLAGCFYLLGNFYFDNKDFPNAVARLKSALIHAEKYSNKFDHEWLANCHQKLGTAEAQCKNPRASIEHFERAIAHFNQIPKAQRKPAHFFNLASTLHEKGICHELNAQLKDTDAAYVAAQFKQADAAYVAAAKAISNGPNIRGSGQLIAKINISLLDSIDPRRKIEAIFNNDSVHARSNMDAHDIRHMSLMMQTISMRLEVDQLKSQMQQVMLANEALQHELAQQKQAAANTLKEQQRHHHSKPSSGLFAAGAKEPPPLPPPLPYTSRARESKR